MVTRKFYDLKDKKSFTTDKFTTFERKVRGGITVFAKTKAPSGITSTVIIGRKK